MMNICINFILDVAVGAPYENEGKGAVYIYHGSKHFMTLAQKLKPERISNQMRTFGWSLSLGVDIDENGYPGIQCIKGFL